MEIRCTEESLGKQAQTAENEGFFFDAEPRKDLNILMMWLVFLFPMNLIGNFFPFSIIVIDFSKRLQLSEKHTLTLLTKSRTTSPFD